MCVCVLGMGEGGCKHEADDAATGNCLLPQGILLSLSLSLSLAFGKKHTQKNWTKEKDMHHTRPAIEPIRPSSIRPPIQLGIPSISAAAAAEFPTSACPAVVSPP